MAIAALSVVARIPRAKTERLWKRVVVAEKKIHRLLQMLQTGMKRRVLQRLSHLTRNQSRCFEQRLPGPWLRQKVLALVRLWCILWENVSTAPRPLPPVVTDLLGTSLFVDFAGAGPGTSHRQSHHLVRSVLCDHLWRG